MEHLKKLASHEEGLVRIKLAEPSWSCRPEEVLLSVDVKAVGTPALGMMVLGLGRGRSVLWRTL